MINSIIGVIISIKWISSILMWLIFCWKVFGLFFCLLICFVSWLNQVLVFVVIIIVCVVLFIMVVFIKYSVLYFSGLLCFGWWVVVVFFMGRDLLVNDVWVMNRFCVCKICKFVGIIFFVVSFIILLGISWLIGIFS